MFKKLFIKQYIKFLKKPGLGKIINAIAKVAFGKIVFITGFNQEGKEFYKMTTTYFLDKSHNKLKENGCTEMEEYLDFESVENAMFTLASNRRKRS